MKTNRIVFAFLMIGLLGTLGVTHAQAHRRGSVSDGQHLEGSWVLTATIEGEPLIHALITFSRDGSFIETAAAPGVSTGHGTWVRTGNRKFALTNVYLRLGDMGEFIGTSKVRANFDLTESLEEGNGRFQTNVFDADGNEVDSFGGTAHAQRIQSEPLE